MSIFRQIFYASYLWPWLGPPLTAVQYVMYFRFWGLRPVFIRWSEWARIKHHAYVSSNSLDGGTRSEVWWLGLQLPCWNKMQQLYGYSCPQSLIFNVQACRYLI